MKKNNKTLYILISCLLIIALLTSCRGGKVVKTTDNKTTSNANSDPGNSTKDKEAEEGSNTNSINPDIQYYFADGLLLGGYQNGTWLSLCDTGGHKNPAGDADVFYAKDLLNQDAYYVYDGKKSVGISKQIIWVTEETGGLGAFEDPKVVGKFEKYGELYQVGGASSSPYYRIFNLPQRLGEELSSLKIPKYSFYTDFVYGQAWDRENYINKLVINSKNNPFPRELNYNAKPTSQGENEIKKLFKEKAMKNTVLHFTNCFSGDLDGDGNIEYVMNANTPVSKNGYPFVEGIGEKDDIGAYSVLLYQDHDGSVQIIYEDLRPFKGEVNNRDQYGAILDAALCFRVEEPTIADLNGDGKYEIIFYKQEWEWGSHFAYALKENGEYELVMRSDSGM